MHLISHMAGCSYCPPGNTRTGYERLGWDNKPALGLSVGCYWDYRDSRTHWFDVPTLEETIRHVVATQPLLVSFNGIAFDFPLMRGLLRQQADALGKKESGFGLLEAAHDVLQILCDAFKTLCASSYDILAEIWRIDPDRKFEPGLNSLGAISQANGYGAKLSHGSQAPRDWREGRYATVLNYCQDDVLKTKVLFEQIIVTGEILRGDGQPIRLRCPLDLVEA